MRILVTAGPTQEYFDTVRFISNPSSGKMGYALASEAHNRGHEVTLVSGPVQILRPDGVTLIDVVSAEQMFEASVSAFEQCGAAIMTAAVCDYRPSRRLDHKLWKRAENRRVTLVPTRDISAHLGRIKGDRILVGFAMEDHDHHAHAEQKLRRKRCDAIVLNGRENIAAEGASIEILLADGTWMPPRQGTKKRIASVVIDLVEELARD